MQRYGNFTKLQQFEVFFIKIRVEVRILPARPACGEWACPRQGRALNKMPLGGQPSGTAC